MSAVTNAKLLEAFFAGSKGAKARLLAAFLAGSKRRFVTAVSHVGVRPAAAILVDFMISRNGTLRSIATQARLLLNTSILRGVPEADLFTHFLLHALSNSYTSPRRKCDVALLFLGEIKTADLRGVDLSRLGIPTVRLLASVITTLLDPLYWVDVAIRNQDRALLSLIKPKLSARDVCRVWETLHSFHCQPRLRLLLDCGIIPPTEDQKIHFLERLAYNPDDQTEIIKALANAWPDIIGRFKIPESPKFPESQWTGMQETKSCHHIKTYNLSQPNFNSSNHADYH